MPIRFPVLISLLLIAIMLGISGWGWQVIPASAQVTTHWDVSGKPNGFMSKEWALLLLPAIATAVCLLLSFVPRIEPRRQNLFASRQLFYATWIGAIAILALSHVLIVMTAAGFAVNVPKFTVAAVAILFIVLGNFLGKSRSTFFFGVRLPWTLTSEYAWSKSNRLAGLVLVATGMLVLPVLFLAGFAAGLAVLITGVATGTLSGAIAAYFYWKHDPSRQTGDMIEH